MILLIGVDVFLIDLKYLIELKNLTLMTKEEFKSGVLKIFISAKHPQAGIPIHV